jgi:hypothetical protein
MFQQLPELIKNKIVSHLRNNEFDMAKQIYDYWANTASNSPLNQPFNDESALSYDNENQQA